MQTLQFPNFGPSGAGGAYGPNAYTTLNPDDGIYYAYATGSPIYDEEGNFIDVVPSYQEPTSNVIGGILYQDGTSYGPYTGMVHYMDGDQIVAHAHYINGQLTGLDSNGTGLFEGTYYDNGQPGTGGFGGVYYVNGVVDTTFSGVFEGLRYSNGALLTGAFEDVQYIQGQLAATFTGEHNGLRYDNGALFNGVLCPSGDSTCFLYVLGVNLGYDAYQAWASSDRTGLFAGTYFINGQLGTGEFEGLRYSNGALFTGLLDSFGTEGELVSRVYYVNGQLGTGEFEGLRYSNGALFTGVFDGTLYINGAADPTFTGVFNGAYYENGQFQTNLPEGGTGSVIDFGSQLHEWGAQWYFINGVFMPGLNPKGSGISNGVLYANGVPNPTYTGYIGHFTPYTGSWGYGQLYVNGVNELAIGKNVSYVRDLGEFGTGLAVHEFSNAPGQWEYITLGYYVNGQLTELDSNGNGVFNGAYYQNGQFLANLPEGGTGSVIINWGPDQERGQWYFIDEVLMPGLNPKGSGISNEVLYVNGVPNPTYTGYIGVFNHIIDDNPWGFYPGTLYVNGEATGQAMLGENGTGEFEGTYYINGQATDAFGWWVHSTGGNGGFEGNFYINGNQTDAWGWFMHSTGGNGDFQGSYYINGQATELDSSGNGVFGGLRYSNGALFTGAFEGLRYSNGALLTGLFEGLRYSNGALLTGLFEGTYYVNGQLGTGLFEGVFYANGVADQTFSGTGVFEGAYYINGQFQTNLPEGGTGSVIDWGSELHPSGAQWYFINGVFMPGLNPDGSGVSNGVLYVNGVPNPTFTGYIGSFDVYISVWDYNGRFYENGQLVRSDVYGLGQTGTGVFEGLRYSNGALLTGAFEGVFYANGVEDQTFTGVHNGLRYSNGALFTGAFEGLRYSEGTLLTGDFEGLRYSNGALFTGAFEGLRYSNGALFTGAFEGLRYSNGALLTGEFEGTYYINGQATGLDENGTGLFQGTYYINGQPGTGLFEGTCYINGQLGTGLFEGTYYVNGQATELNSIGTGSFQGTYYIFGIATTLDANGTGYTSYFEGDGSNAGYFINGVRMWGLDSNGTGMFAGLRYENGALFTGDFEGQTYVNGVVQNGGGGGGGSVNLESGLQAFYKLSDLSDSSGNNRTLTNNGNVSFASGKIGNAAVFDGSNYLATNLTVPAGSFSVAAWIKFSDTTGFCGAIGTSDNAFSISYRSDTGEAYLWLSEQPAGSSFSNPSVAFSLFDEWVFVVAGRDAGNNSWFSLNGNEKIIGGQLDFSGTSTIDIGSSAGGSLNNLSIDAVGIWNRALSDSEVAALYNSGNGLELPAGPASTPTPTSTPTLTSTPTPTGTPAPTSTPTSSGDGGDGTGGGGSIKVTGKSKFIGKVKFAAGTNGN